MHQAQGCYRPMALTAPFRYEQQHSESLLTVLHVNFKAETVLWPIVIALPDLEIDADKQVL